MNLKTWAKAKLPPFLAKILNQPVATTTESGKRPTPENALKYLYRTMWVDPDLRQAILDIREMDRKDGRVKRIHGRLARDTVKGGLPGLGAGLRQSPHFSRRLRRLDDSRDHGQDSDGRADHGNHS